MATAKKTIEKVTVKLNPLLMKRKAGLVDPENGVMISGNGALTVDKTRFVVQRMNAGELVEVKPTGAK